MFFGGDFTISRGNIVAGEAPFVSTWGEGHGIEAILNWKCLLLGLTLLMLARTNAALYFLNNINKGEEFSKRQRISALNNGAVFVVLFLALAVVVLSADGYALNQLGQFEAVAYKYADNLITLWWLGLGLLIGVAAVLYGLVKTLVKSGYRYGIWWTGAGTVLVILTLMCALGYNGTAYLPSTTSPESSLTIANSSSSEFTLTVMSWVSIISPFVIAYIYVVWRKLSSPALTAKEVDEDSHSY
jgi:cytochrome d ubiquinol oxidase subunit II